MKKTVNSLMIRAMKILTQIREEEIVKALLREEGE